MRGISTLLAVLCCFLPVLLWPSAMVAVAIVLTRPNQ
jgi:hypothetical protein